MAARPDDFLPQSGCSSLNSDNLLPRVVAVGLEYEGCAYHGWQRQAPSVGPTVQETVENALSKIADQPLGISVAGRTDAGVHACAQVVHFRTAVVRPVQAWISGGNSLLPRNIRLRWGRQVASHFHARFSAILRRYRYIYYDLPYRSALLGGRLTWAGGTALDHSAMNTAAAVLVGEHDFSSFRAAGCQSRSSRRTISHCSVARRGALVVVDIEANGFLYHMVRNIASALREIGLGRHPPEWLVQLLEAGDRCLSPATAPPDGLYLVDVRYPDEFSLPPTDAFGPVFLVS